MFSGIVEAQASVLQYEQKGLSARILVAKPTHFDDLQIGDSIAINGVCLTLTEQDENQMAFDLGPETLKITGWTATSLQGTFLNLERSLQVSRRVHGHFVAGHVDEMGIISQAIPAGDSRVLWVGFSKSFAAFLWKKGSVAVNGVSLTINEIEDCQFQVTLIPETLRRTNLGQLDEGDHVTLEADTMARGLVHFLKTRETDL